MQCHNGCVMDSSLRPLHYRKGGDLIFLVGGVDANGLVLLHLLGRGGLLDDLLECVMLDARLAGFGLRLLLLFFLLSDLGGAGVDAGLVPVAQAGAGVGDGEGYPRADASFLSLQQFPVKGRQKRGLQSAPYMGWRRELTH